MIVPELAAAIVMVPVEAAPEVVLTPAEAVRAVPELAAEAVTDVQVPAKALVKTLVFLAVQQLVHLLAPAVQETARADAKQIAQGNATIAAQQNHRRKSLQH